MCITDFFRVPDFEPRTLGIPEARSRSPERALGFWNTGVSMSICALSFSVCHRRFNWLVELSLKRNGGTPNRLEPHRAVFSATLTLLHDRIIK